MKRDEKGCSDNGHFTVIWECTYSAKTHKDAAKRALKDLQYKSKEWCHLFKVNKLGEKDKLIVLDSN